MAVDLVINPEHVCIFIVKARQINVKEVSGFEDDGSDEPDDGMHSVLQEDSDDATRQELGDMIDSLNEEEAAELVAMIWIGRGDYDVREFDQAKNDARDPRRPARAGRRGLICPAADWFVRSAFRSGRHCTFVIPDAAASVADA